MSDTVRLETTMGNITLALDAERAPKSVANFLRYVDEGHYDGTVFHRVIESFMAQGGGYDTEYNKKPVHEAIENEADNGLKNVRGTLAMARTSDPHSATSQFFINVKDNPFLNHKGKDARGWGYTVFGRVIKGLDVVDRIRQTETGAVGPFDKDAPLEPVVITKISRQ
jgi:cyclophilin family peptidyl-prolyl cis-trans isomerase